MQTLSQPTNSNSNPSSLGGGWEEASFIYLISSNQQLFENDLYKCISVEDSLTLLNQCQVLQADSETTGIDPHIDRLLSFQLGNDRLNFRMVIDCSTINICLYKDILESKLLVFQNGKFDLQFLYTKGIIPRHIYDTMIVEQLLHLGWPNGQISYSLKAIAKRRLDVDLDKTIRGQIIWRGLDADVINYAANDVVWLEKIMHQQVAECRLKKCLEGAKLECNSVPFMAYLEWCGIKLDEQKWKDKMKLDKQNLDNARTALNHWFVHKSDSISDFKQYIFIDRQGDLFSGFNLEPQVSINWASSRQVIEVAKKLGFNTVTQDKQTGEDKDSVLEKFLKNQKGIDDEFLNLYFKFKECDKIVSSFGQSHLDIINPVTGRIHTNFKQLGASSGRMSCGGGTNSSIAKLRHISPQKCKNPNLQQLPSNDITRSCFVAEKGNLTVACDYSAMEGRLAADIYNDKAMIEDFLHGTKDSHSLFAWMVFRKECEECGCKTVFDVKEKAPQWRKKVKAVEFAYLFGAAAPTISQSANCTVEQAQSYIDSLNAGFIGLDKFVVEGSKFVRKHGYVLMNKYTGHKMYWWDHDKWLNMQQSFNQEFWEDYKKKHKGTGDEIAQMVREHFQAAGKWDRMARNAPTQGTGACITKLACTNLFNWIVDSNYFNKVKITCVVHDEIVCEFPQDLVEFPKILEEFMENAAAKYCHSLPIPACAEVGDHWIH